MIQKRVLRFVKIRRTIYFFFARLLNKIITLPKNGSTFQLYTKDSSIWKQSNYLTSHNIDKGEEHKVVVVNDGDNLVVVDWRAYKWNNQTLSNIYLIIDKENLK